MEFNIKRRAYLYVNDKLYIYIKVNRTSTNKNIINLNT